MGRAPVIVRFLGSGDAFGSGGRLQSCIFVDSPEGRFLIDCGETALVGMKRFGLDSSMIGSIFISHLHGDH
ncbi:MAG TPA: MBL fold metallo-hydrolase, partial [Deltaproteobacteria bacterium]|nr:MBL fold metallo-hydrolase [Deltaproteobacteria bacterium]